MPTPPRDRFDDIPPSPHRVGAHRAENPRVRGWTTFLWALAATIVLVVVGVVISLIADGKISWEPRPTPSVASPAPVEPVVDTSFSVLVLNGTTQTGLATQVRDTLLANGWGADLVTASNASNHDFPTTTVYYTVAEAEAAAKGLAGIVGASEVVLDPGYPLPDTPANQLTVVLGNDLIAPVEPSTAP